MYLRGRLTIDLTDTRIALSPPRNFFGGVANLMTGGSWQTREAMETYKLLSFAQSANRALMDVGVKDVVRVSIGREPIYEDLRNTPDDFEAAMQALQQKLSQGYEPDPHSEFDLVLKHDDGVLRYVIDLARGVVFAGSRDYARVVLLSPVTNAAVLALMFAAFMVLGTTLFVRRETNR